MLSTPLVKLWEVIPNPRVVLQDLPETAASVERAAPQEFEGHALILPSKRPRFPLGPDDIHAGNLGEKRRPMRLLNLSVAVVPGVPYPEEDCKQVTRVLGSVFHEEIEVDVVPLVEAPGGQGTGQRDALQERAVAEQILGEPMSHVEVFRLQARVAPEATLRFGSTVVSVVKAD